MTRLGEMKKDVAKEGIAGLIIKHKFLIIAFIAILFIALEAIAFVNVNNANESGIVLIDYYYSHACGVCKKTTPVLEKLANDFGKRIVLEKKCVTLTNESSTECIREQGLGRYEENMAEVRALGTRGTPTTLFNGNTVVGAFDEKSAKRETCNALYGIWETIDLTGSKIEECR